jgi:TonB family protein
MEDAALLDELLGACAGLVRAGDYNSDHWERVFQHHLERPELASPAARDGLEQQLAQHFAAGWQPGLDLLLLAAAKAFDWFGQSARLLRFGQAGAQVAAALDENVRFRHQATPLLNLQWAAIRHMREGVGSDGRRIRRTLTYFRKLRQDYPAWLQMAASQPAIAEWAQIDARAPEELRRQYKDARGPLIMQWGMVLSLVIFVIVRLATPAPPPKHRADNYIAQTGNYKPNREWINDILRRIDYTSPAGLRQGARPGTYAIQLTTLGNVESIRVEQASSDPAFDAAAMKAIRQSPGFPSDIARHFTLTLHP